MILLIFIVDNHSIYPLLRDIDTYYLQKDEPVKSCLLFLREFILGFDKDITEAWKYRMPFFCYKGKMFCYLWINKKNGQPYLGMVDGRLLDHPLLIAEKRSRMKIVLIDENKDIPVKMIGTILQMAIDVCNKSL